MADILLGSINMQQVFRYLFMAEFALLAMAGFTGFFKLITLDRTIRKHYDERLDAFNTFFRVYVDEKQRIDAEAENRRKRLEDMRASSSAENVLSSLNIPEAKSYLPDLDEDEVDDGI